MAFENYLERRIDSLVPDSPDSLIRGGYTSGADMIPSGVFTLLTWEYSYGGEPLNIVDSQNPIIITSGVYAVGMTVLTNPIDGKYAFMELDIDANGADPNIFSRFDLNTSSSSVPSGTVSLTYYIPAGGTLQLGIRHDIGVDHMFRSYGTVQRLV